LITPTLERHAQDALAFAMAVNVRGIEEADAAIKCRLNEPEGVSPITAKNGTKSSAAESKPLLNDVNLGRVVHLTEPELLICIVPRGATGENVMKTCGLSIVSSALGSISCRLNCRLR
jgi:hypothetical protein